MNAFVDDVCGPGGLAVLACEKLTDRLRGRHPIDVTAYAGRLDDEAHWFRLHPDLALHASRAAALLGLATRARVRFASWDASARFVTAYALGLTDIDPVEHGLPPVMHARSVQHLETAVCAVRRNELVEQARALRLDEHGSHVLVSNRLCSVLGRVEAATSVAAPERDFDERAYAALVSPDVCEALDPSKTSLSTLFAEMNPGSLHDVAAAWALGQVPPSSAEAFFESRAASRSAPHAVIDEEVRSTHGIPIFREQLCAILRRTSSLSWTDSDRVVRWAAQGDPRARVHFLNATLLPAGEADDVFAWVAANALWSYPKVMALGCALMLMRAAFYVAHFHDAFRLAAREVDATIPRST